MLYVQYLQGEKEIDKKETARRIGPPVPYPRTEERVYCIWCLCTITDNNSQLITIRPKKKSWRFFGLIKKFKIWFWGGVGELQSPCDAHQQQHDVAAAP